MLRKSPHRKRPTIESSIGSGDKLQAIGVLKRDLASPNMKDQLEAIVAERGFGEAIRSLAKRKLRLLEEAEKWKRAKPLGPNPTNEEFGATMVAALRHGASKSVRMREILQQAEKLEQAIRNEKMTPVTPRPQ